MIIQYIPTTQLDMAYIEKNASASKTIFFIHGNSGSFQIWTKQFESPQFDGYRLLALDLPGCGHSVIKDHTNYDYSTISAACTTASAILQLHHDKPYALVGLSLGSCVVAEMLDFGLTPNAISLVSPCVTGPNFGLEKIFLPGDNVFFYDSPEEEKVFEYFKHSLATNNEDNARLLTQEFFLARPPFRSKLIASVGEGKMSDEIQLLQEVKFPIQIINGENDTLVSNTYLHEQPFICWNNTINKIPAANHFVNLDEPAKFNELLAAYLSERL